jgi:hypothetical protein
MVTHETQQRRRLTTEARRRLSEPANHANNAKAEIEIAKSDASDLFQVDGRNRERTAGATDFKDLNGFDAVW